METGFRLESDKQRRIRSARRKEYALRHAKQVEQYDAGFEADHPRDQGGGDEAGQFTENPGGSASEIPNIAQKPATIEPIFVAYNTMLKEAAARGTQTEISAAMPELDEIWGKDSGIITLIDASKIDHSNDPANKENQRQWEMSLDETEIHAINVWGTDNGCTVFRELDVNPNQPSTRGVFSSDFDELYPMFRAAMDRAPRYQGEIFRGLDLSESTTESDEAFASLTTPGHEFRLNATSSFSEQKDTSLLFARPLGGMESRGIVMSVNTTQGARISAIKPGEQEVTISPGASYRVVSTEEESKTYENGFVQNYTHVRLEETHDDDEAQAEQPESIGSIYTSIRDKVNDGLVPFAQEGDDPDTDQWELDPSATRSLESLWHLSGTSSGFLQPAGDDMIAVLDDHGRVDYFHEIGTDTATTAQEMQKFLQTEFGDKRPNGNYEAGVYDALRGQFGGYEPNPSEATDMLFSMADDAVTSESESTRKSLVQFASMAADNPTSPVSRITPKTIELPGDAAWTTLLIDTNGNTMSRDDAEMAATNAEGYYEQRMEENNPIALQEAFAEELSESHGDRTDIQELYNIFISRK